MAVRPLSLLPRPSKGPDGSSTRLGAQDTSYGWTGGDDEAANYTPQTTFRIFPNALVGKSVECDLRMEGRTCKVVLEVATILSKSAVMTQCQDQVQDALLWANGVTEKDWKVFASRMMEGFLLHYRASPVDKVPVKSIGPQVQLWPPHLKDFTPEHLEYFFNSKDGILDSTGVQKPHAKCAFDQTEMRGAKQIHYTPSGGDGFSAFLEEPQARGHGVAYFSGVMNSVLPALYGWASSFNRKYLKKMMTLLCEGSPGVGKTYGAKTALALGSSQDHFYSGSSTVAGIQESLSCHSLLAVVDDMESRKKEEQMILVDYEGAVTQTVTGGSRARIAPLLITMNPEDKERKEKFLTGRCLVLNCTNAPYTDPPGALQNLNDLIGVNQSLQESTKPFDFLIRGFHELYFSKDDIPEVLKQELQSHEFISDDGEKCCRYLIFLAQTCQEIKNLTGRSWREVLGHAMFFMWPRVLDDWLEDRPGHKWWQEGGSPYFYREFMPQYYKSVVQSDATNNDQESEEFVDNFLLPIVETLKKRDTQSESPGDQVKEMRLVTKRDVNKVFLWFAQPQTTDYQALYGVNSDLNSHLGLIKQWGGGTHTVCAGGGTKRGWMFSVEHLPTPLVRDIFHLLGRRSMKAAMERVWQSLVGEEDEGEDDREEEVVQQDIQLQEGRQEGRQEREDANIALTPPASQAQYKATESFDPLVDDEVHNSEDESAEDDIEMEEKVERKKTKKRVLEEAPKSKKKRKTVK